VLMQE